MPTMYLHEFPAFAIKSVNDFELLLARSHRDQMEHIRRGNEGELRILKNLHLAGHTMTPSELSLAMDSSTARISALLRTLEQKEQIKRMIDKQDRRYIHVSITPKGIARVKEEIGQMRESLANVFMAMGQEDTAEFLRLSALFSALVKKQLSAHN